MFFDEEVAVVDEEAVELRQVLLLCHVSFIMSINYSNNDLPTKVLTNNGGNKGSG